MNIGYLIEDEQGYPLAAASDWGECLSMTFMRVTELYGGDLTYAGDIQIQERDLTEEEAENLNKIVTDWLGSLEAA